METDDFFSLSLILSFSFSTVIFYNKQNGHKKSGRELNAII
jgi:hypothetical protein